MQHSPVINAYWTHRNALLKIVIKILDGTENRIQRVILWNEKILYEVHNGITRAYFTTTVRKLKKHFY